METPNIIKLEIIYGKMSFESLIGMKNIENTTRKKAFVDSFSLSMKGISVKVGYCSYMLSMPVSRKV